jgi:hypothetical protein
MASEKDDFTEVTSRKLSYSVLIIIGVVVNLNIMIVAAIVFPTYATLLNIFVIPIPVTFVYCLYASTTTLKRVVVSPAIVMVGNLIGALLLNGLNVFFLYPTSLYAPEYARSALYSGLYVTILFFMVWILLAVPLNRIIRAFIGAYAEPDKIESFMDFYTSQNNPDELLYQIENYEWLNDICSLEVVDKKELKDSLRLRLRKLETDYYVGLYAKQKGKGKTTISLTPHKIYQDLWSKIITSSEDCKGTLKYQIKELETQLKLETASKEEAKILPESINYVTSPARFPMFVKYKNQVAIMLVAMFIISSSFVAFIYGALDSTFLVSIVTVTITSTLTLLNLTLRKR